MRRVNGPEEQENQSRSQARNRGVDVPKRTSVGRQSGRYSRTGMNQTPQYCCPGAEVSHLLVRPNCSSDQANASSASHFRSDAKPARQRGIRVSEPDASAREPEPDASAREPEPDASAREPEPEASARARRDAGCGCSFVPRLRASGYDGACFLAYASGYDGACFLADASGYDAGSCLAYASGFRHWPSRV